MSFPQHSNAPHQRHGPGLRLRDTWQGFIFHLSVGIQIMYETFR